MIHFSSLNEPSTTFALPLHRDHGSRPQAPLGEPYQVKSPKLWQASLISSLQKTDTDSQDPGGKKSSTSCELLWPLLFDERRFKEKLHPKTPLIERVLLRVGIDDDGCWIFCGATDSVGYGAINFKGEVVRTHVVMFSAEYRFTPSDFGLVTDHLCRNKRCCNPAHLEAVTQFENRFVRAFRANGTALATHCYLGHEMTEENTYLRPDGKGRQCRTCIKRRTRAARRPPWKGSRGPSLPS